MKDEKQKIVTTQSLPLLNYVTIACSLEVVASAVSLRGRSISHCAAVHLWTAFSVMLGEPFKSEHGKNILVQVGKCYKAKLDLLS